jgi:hypothetical protein
VDLITGIPPTVSIEQRINLCRISVGSGLQLALRRSESQNVACE